MVITVFIVLFLLYFMMRFGGPGKVIFEGFISVCLVIGVSIGNIILAFLVLLKIFGKE